MSGKAIGPICQQSQRRDANNLQNEVGNPLEDITQAMGKAMGLKVTGTLKKCKVCTYRKTKTAEISKSAVVNSKIKGGHLFYICSP